MTDLLPPPRPRRGRSRTDRRGRLHDARVCCVFRASVCREDAQRFRKQERCVSEEETSTSCSPYPLSCTGSARVSRQSLRCRCKFVTHSPPISHPLITLPSPKIPRPSLPTLHPAHPPHPISRPLPTHFIVFSAAAAFSPSASLSASSASLSSARRFFSFLSTCQPPGGATSHSPWYSCTFLYT